MSTFESTSPVVPGGMPTWSDRDQFFKTRRWFRFLVTIMVVLWLILITWVLVSPINDAEALPLAVGANLTIVLAPVLAAAAAVERTLESVFNVLEGSWRTMVAYLGRGLRWLKNAEIEVQQARQFLDEISDKYSAELQGIQFGQMSVSTLTNEIQARIDAANKLMTLAQQRLENAESNLADITSSESYISAKAAASIILGLMLGVIIAAIGQLQMFAMLGIGIVPSQIDVLITGLVIGSGAYPVHSLVGILQQGKGAVDSVKGYFNRLSPEAQATRQQITTVQSPTEAGEPAQIQQSVVETTTAKSKEEGTST
jgi:exonuclease VII small subunit